MTTLNVRAMTAFPSSGALQSSLIDRVPLNCRPINAQSCVFSSYDVIPGAQGGGGASAPKELPPLDPRLAQGYALLPNVDMCNGWGCSAQQEHGAVFSKNSVFAGN